VIPRRLTVLFLIVVVVVVVVATSAGCSPIPLFDPDAQPLNRIASANEVIAELNTLVAGYRDLGWLDQSTINRTVGPVLDRAAADADAAEQLVRAGAAAEANAKLDMIAVSLRALRAQLRELERKHQ
jgi:hypothetical protein